MGQEDTASCIAVATAFPTETEATIDARAEVPSEGTPKGDPMEEGTKDPFNKGLRSYIQECPWQGRGESKQSCQTMAKPVGFFMKSPRVRKTVISSAHSKASDATRQRP